MPLFRPLNTKVPEDITAEATSPDGAEVSFGEVSADNGQTFGLVLNLGTNGTLSTTTTGNTTTTAEGEAVTE